MSQSLADRVCRKMSVPISVVPTSTVLGPGGDYNGPPINNQFTETQERR